jgi:hypothetical protein
VLRFLVYINIASNVSLAPFDEIHQAQSRQYGTKGPMKLENGEKTFLKRALPEAKLHILSYHARNCEGVRLKHLLKNLKILRNSQNHLPHPHMETQLLI